MRNRWIRSSRLIHSAIRIEHAAARRLGVVCADSPIPELPRAMRALEARLEACPEAERPFLLAGYGNLISNRRELGFEQ